MKIKRFSSTLSSAEMKRLKELGDKRTYEIMRVIKPLLSFKFLDPKFSLDLWTDEGETKDFIEDIKRILKVLPLEMQFHHVLDADLGLSEADWQSGMKLSSISIDDDHEYDFCWRFIKNSKIEKAYQSPNYELEGFDFSFTVKGRKVDWNVDHVENGKDKKIFPP